MFHNSFGKQLTLMIVCYQKYAHEEITSTLLTYLSRYQEFDSSEQMKRVVSLLHRQAVKAKAEGLFFKVNALFFLLSQV